MISLSAPVFDPDGHIVIDELPDSDMGTVRRRGSRVATLGPEGAVSQDRGYFFADRDFEVRWAVTNHDQYASVRRLVELYPRINISTAEGVFIVWPQSISIDQDGEAVLSLLVLEMIS